MLLKNIELGFFFIRRSFGMTLYIILVFNGITEYTKYTNYTKYTTTGEYRMNLLHYLLITVHIQYFNTKFKVKIGIKV